jgi:hypothetical protein
MPSTSRSPLPPARTADGSSSLCLPKAVPVKLNDVVVYLARPDWNLGLIEWVAPNGWLIVSFETPDGPYRGEFGPHELEMAERAEAAATILLGHEGSIPLCLPGPDRLPPFRAPLRCFPFSATPRFKHSAAQPETSPPPQP